MKTPTTTWIVRLALLPLVASVVPGCPTCSYLCYRMSPDYPNNEDQTLTLPGLSQPVTVLFDQAGVPHIDAATERDLMLAVGFVQARSRFFQMDMLRRFAQGRLAELVGDQPILDSTTVATDMAMRWWGLGRAAEEDARALEGEVGEWMVAYTQGVNAALERYVPLEYRLLDVDPEPWRIQDSFAVGRLVAWTITHNFNQEISRLLLAIHGGVDRAEQIYPSAPWPGTSSLPPGDARIALAPAIAPEVRELFPPRPYRAPEANRPGDRESPTLLASLQTGASNAWVVGSSRSASGMPILANDPHLTHFLPSVMFQQHLRSPDLDVIGVTTPGLPYVLAGHNQRVAWGMTSAVGDVVDLYVERVNPENPEEVLGTDGLFHPMQQEEVVVLVREGDDLVEHRAAFRSTANGRLLNDLYPGLLPDWAPLVTLHLETGGGPQTILGFALADRAGSFQQLRDALSLVIAPVNAWTAADVDGHVGLFMAGRIPLRSHHLGTFAAPGWLEAYQWQPFGDSASLPGAVGEGDAVFIHTNNLVVPPDRSPIPFHVDTAPSYRFDRILELLSATRLHTLESMGAIQQDILLLQAERLVPVMVGDLEARTDLDALETSALDILARWNYEAPVDAAAPAIFYQTYREAFVQAIEDEVDEPGLAFILSERYATNPADLWFENADHVVWDHRGTAGTENRADVVRAAFGRAVSGLAEQLGPDPGGWRWGRLHDFQLNHPFGGRESLADLVNLPSDELPGGPDSVWKTHFDLGRTEHPFRVIAGPVLRMVVDLADIEHGLWVLDTGTSGWPSDPHYGDQYPIWRSGGYLPMLSDWEELLRLAEGVMTLVPEG